MGNILLSKYQLMGRLLIISNRLPFSLDRQGDKVSIRQSSGGLVSAIKSYFENSTGQKDHPLQTASRKEGIKEKLWMGVADFPQEDWDIAVTEHTDKQDFTVCPIFVDKEAYDNYYNG